MSSLSFDSNVPGTRADGLLRILLLVAGICVFWALAFHATFLDMVSIWRRSDTFAHGMVVAPISAYLIWQRRDALRAVAVSPAWILSIPLLLCVLAWLAGLVFSIAALEHLAATSCLIFMIWLVLGHEAFRPIAFPVGFLIFMAPVGDFLVPVLVHYTAEFTVGALRLSGIPVYQEGTNFVLPNGRWSVVEACSGVRYLIASLMVGALYAYLNYRSLWRRLVFLGAALVVPILANWLRAYLIVILGYLSDNEIATGVDHLVYGWVFFGLVILLLFWVGSFWREDEVPVFRATGTAGAPDSRTYASLGLVAVVLICALWMGASLRPGASEVNIPVAAPAPMGAWRSVESEGGYQPVFQGYRGLVKAAYELDDVRVHLMIAVFKDQGAGHEMIGWNNTLVPDPRLWSVLKRSSVAREAGAFNALTLNGLEGEVAIRQWYRVGDHLETGAQDAMMRLAINRLMSGSDASANVVLWTSGEATVIDRFLADHAEQLDASLHDALNAPGS